MKLAEKMAFFEKAARNPSQPGDSPEVIERKQRKGVRRFAIKTLGRCKSERLMELDDLAEAMMSLNMARNIWEGKYIVYNVVGTNLDYNGKYLRIDEVMQEHKKRYLVRAGRL